MDLDSLGIDYEGSLILEDMEIRGDVKSDKGLYLKGMIRGGLHGSLRLIVEHEAVIDGDVDCDELFVDGTITGNVRVSAKTVMGVHAVIKGGLITESLEITPGALVVGGLKLEKSNKK